jgi:hypothetical protein
MTFFKPEPTPGKVFTREQAEKMIGSTECEHCGALHTIRRRSLNATMALQLAALYRYFKRPAQFGNLQFHMVDSSGHWLHASHYFMHHRIERECLKLRFWGFIEEHHGTREDGNPHNGFVRLTDRGLKFCEMRMKTYKYIMTKNQGAGFVGFIDGEVLNIVEAGQNGFDYGKEIGGWR